MLAPSKRGAADQSRGVSSIVEQTTLFFLFFLFDGTAPVGCALQTASVPVSTRERLRSRVDRSRGRFGFYLLGRAQSIVFGRVYDPPKPDHRVLSRGSINRVHTDRVLHDHNRDQSFGTSMRADRHPRGEGLVCFVCSTVRVLLPSGMDDRFPRPLERYSSCHKASRNKRLDARWCR